MRAMTRVTGGPNIDNMAIFIYFFYVMLRVGSSNVVLLSQVVKHIHF